MDQGRGLIQPLGGWRGVHLAPIPWHRGEPYGRLLRTDCDTGGRVDTFCTIAQRLIGFAIVLVLGLLPVSVARACNGLSEQQAWDACKAWITANGGGNSKYVCQKRPEPGYANQVWLMVTGGDPITNWPYDGTCPVQPTPGICAATIPAVTTPLPGKVLAGFAEPQTITDPATGGSVQCIIQWTPKSPPTLTQWGKWQTLATGAPQPNPGGGTGADGQFVDPKGGVPDPPVPALPAPATNAPAPQVCGAGMCYDPNTDSYSYSDGAGHTIKVDGNTARSASGGCSSSGSGTICAGSPSAPTPPAPPASPITDPATQAKSVDVTVQADPVTGANQKVTTVTYGTPGTTPSNGAKPGDLTPPASSSTAPSPPGSYGGGGDCSSPPVCTGDAVMCGIGRQSWAQQCQLHKDLAGDGNGPQDFDALKTKYSQSDVWSDPDTSQSGTVGGQANAGNYDQSGFGLNRSCPLKDLTVPFGNDSFSIALSAGCVIGPWLRAVIIGFALFSAAVITAGGRG